MVRGTLAVGVGSWVHGRVARAKRTRDDTAAQGTKRSAPTKGSVAAVVQQYEAAAQQGEAEVAAAATAAAASAASAAAQQQQQQQREEKEGSVRREGKAHPRSLRFWLPL